MEEIKFTPIGKIRSPFKKPEGTPIQPPASEGVEGEVELLPTYTEGLKDIEGFSHLILIYYCHLSDEHSLTVKPFMEDEYHGIFAIRAPSRPNSIGLSIVRLTEVEGIYIHIKDVDIVDQTPLLDIKPYVAAFDKREETKSGWLEGNLDKLSDQRDDGRFVKNEDKKQE